MDLVEGQIKVGEETKMVEYNIVKHCSMCRKRFVVEKSARKSIYCTSCQRKYSTRKAAVA